MSSPLLIFNAPLALNQPQIYDANGTIVGTRPELNLIAGSNITITGSDNSSANRMDVTITGSGGAAGLTGTGMYLTDGTKFYITAPALHQITKPPTVASGSYSWISIQGSASVSDISGGGLFMTDTNTALGLSVWGSALPAAPYTITADIIIQNWPTGQNWFGLTLMHGTGTAAPIIIFGPLANPSPTLEIDTWNSATSFGSQIKSKPIWYYPYFALRIKDDGANRFYSWSSDGIDFIQFFTSTNTSFLTADHFGVAINRAQNTLTETISETVLNVTVTTP